MHGAPNLPEWAAWLTALLILAGFAITLTSAIGLVKLQSFYERVHAPTLGGTLVAGLILLSSMLSFSVFQSRPILHEILMAALISLTTPVTLIPLVRAALYRDRAEGREDVPRDE